VGNFLSRSFDNMDKVSRDLPSGFVEMAEQAFTDFGLQKIKVAFCPSGVKKSFTERSKINFGRA